MFQQLVSFTKKVADLADKPSINASELKAQFDAAPDEVRQYLNNLIDALKSTTLGDSGAKNIGATSISGLTGTDIQAILESLNSLTAKKQQEGWNGITFQNGWTALSSEYEYGSYRKDHFDMVDLRGVLKPGTTTDGTVICQLPAGYRPERTVVAIVSTSDGNSDYPARLHIDPDGDVHAYKAKSGHFQFGGIRFYAYQ